jgi:hypothetical protein
MVLALHANICLGSDTLPDANLAIHLACLLWVSEVLSALCLGGLVEVCGLLADGYHYSQDNWGQAQADNRLWRDRWKGILLLMGACYTL